MQRTIGILLVVIALSAVVFAEDALDTNSPQVIAVKAPLVQKGLFTTHSAPASEGYSPVEGAVRRCLRWLKATQNDDGSWGDGTAEPKSVATGAALLPFIWHGESPASPEFGKTVDGAITYLLSVIAHTDDPDGKRATAIEHGICTRALCLSYWMTRLPRLAPACTNAVRAILAAQRPSGFWDMQYKTERGADDTEASVWQMLALHDAMLADIEEVGLPLAFNRGEDALKQTVEKESKAKKTAPAVYCIQLAGHPKDLACKTGLESFNGLTMNWDNPDFPDPVRQWHFITQSKFNDGGKQWEEWNSSFVPELVRRQMVSSDRGLGYWESPGKNERYGRVYATALCCLMLENYYAWTPYTRVLQVKEPKDKTKAERDIKIGIPGAL